MITHPQRCHSAIMRPLLLLFGALITKYGINIEIWICSCTMFDSPISPPDGTSHHYIIITVLLPVTS